MPGQEGKPVDQRKVKQVEKKRHAAEHERNAPVPARNTNTGAQKCVIQRVRKSAGKVRVRFSGSKGLFEKKSREWSSAMSSMTQPRSRSTDSKRGRAAGAGGRANDG